MAEQFLVVKNYLKNENKQQRNLDLMAVLREKRLVNAYELKRQKLKKEQKTPQKESIKKYWQKYQIAKEEYAWQSTFNKSKGDLGIPELLQWLDLFFMLERTDLLNQLLLQQKVSALTIPAPPKLLVFPPLDSEEKEATQPVLFILKRIQALLLNPEPTVAGFGQLMELISKHESEFSDDLLKSIFTYLRNFCTMLTNTGLSNLYITLHQIQRDNLERGYFHYGGQIMPNALLNMTSVALKCNQIEWAKEVIESNRYKILDVNESENIYNHNLALCLFKERKYEDSLQKISFSTSHTFYLLSARRLELKIYYELNSELLIYKIDSFRKFLERTAPKIFTNKDRVMHLNFVGMLVQLSQSRPKDTQRSARLVKRIIEKKLLSDRVWLLEKAKALS
ncbi:MAG: hypothetical protein ACKVT2_00320 [Saprospiraceae bacterium]